MLQATINKDALMEMFGEPKRRILKMVVTDSDDGGYIATFEYGMKDMIFSFSDLITLKKKIDDILQDAFTKHPKKVGPLSADEIKKLTEEN